MINIVPLPRPQIGRKAARPKPLKMNGECGTADKKKDGEGEAPSKVVVDETCAASDGSSVASSQLISGPAWSTPGRGGGGARAGQGWGASNCGESADLSVNVDDFSNDGSYFLLDEGGRHVLDDQGSPARAKKWQPSNTHQREQYIRQYLATKGPRPTRRWLQSVLVSPDHLRVPRARTAKTNSTIKGVSIGASALLAGGHHASGVGTSVGKEHEIVGASRRREIEENKKRRRFLAEERRRKRPKQLDGFMLMDACGCELPDEGRTADVSGRGLIGVVQEDLSYFVRMQTVDAGDNSLPFDSFACLPRLEEFRVPCNGIRDIALTRSGYRELRRLDLSYNSVSGDALAALARLPSLVDLDLTCNGLTNLPESMGTLEQLQRLSLERNQLESEAVIDVLSRLPALRELNLAFNYFRGVHLTPDAAECGFPLLESLDLGFNYIGDEDGVVVLVLLERLQRIILYGNPLTGPTGEDPLGLSVEGLVDKADRVREGWASYPIEFITEMPRKKQPRGVGGGRGRRRPYGDIGITMVDEGCLPSATAFRAAGNESLFIFDRPDRERGGSESADKIVEATLSTARERCKQRARSSNPNNEEDFTFMTGVERQDKGEYDGDGEVVANSGDGTGAGEGDGEGVGGRGGKGFGEMSARLLRRPVDPVVRGDPVKLRIAVAALRYTLKHPVVSSMDVSADEAGESINAGRGGSTKDRDGGVGRKTVAARARQLPRRPYQLLKARQGALVGGSPRRGGGGDLGKVDEVLTSMGVDVDEMTLEKRVGAQNAVQPGGRPELSNIIRTVNAILDENEY